MHLGFGCPAIVWCCCMWLLFVQLLGNPPMWACDRLFPLTPVRRTRSAAWQVEFTRFCRRR
eukprot:12227348-Alexandrium_andersonii.AAC.1